MAKVRSNAAKAKKYFLRSPYGAYYDRRAPRESLAPGGRLPKENAELTHVGPGTPCGEYLRRFWQPVALSKDVQDLPKAMKILDEELVVYRDTRGIVGCLELHCSHRGASLEFGVTQERGIRCCYHGWLFDADGTILDTPTEAPDSRLKEKLFHPAYPVHEHNGLIFVYMGPPDKKPAFPIFDTYEVPGYHVVPGIPHVIPCNWLQLKENTADPIHIPILHQRITGHHFSGYRFDDAQMPEFDWVETPLGMISGLVGRSKDVIWVRWSEWIMPNIHQFHITESAGDCVIGKFCPPRATRWHVPVDDTHTVVFDYQRLLDKELDRAEKVLKSFGQRGDRSYEEQQRRPGDYEAQVSQRPIAIHALEHLGASDRGVIMFRKLLRQQIRVVRQGEDPKGIDAMGNKPIATYLRNTSFVVPPRPSPEEDRKLWREMARKVAEEALVDRDSRWKSNITLTPYEGLRSEFSG
jgi:phenylpropionate dioxygenase-like ring-hydroxylating dioxygenase large terminal subunit